nr:hypothetical protein [Tanacetum cinerariifolium]
MGTRERKPYKGSLPKCTKCQCHHNGLCTQKCHKCNKVWHFARDCRSSGNTNVTNTQRDSKETPKGNGCFEYGALGHFKRDCPKLRNKNGGNRSAQGWVYAVGNAKKNGNTPMNPDSNVVTGTFLLNSRYASILFDTGADRSFISTAFSSLLNIDPTPLGSSYDVELADGKIVRIDTIIRCRHVEGIIRSHLHFRLHRFRTGESILGSRRGAIRRRFFAGHRVRIRWTPYDASGPTVTILHTRPRRATDTTSTSRRGRA